MIVFGLEGNEDTVTQSSFIGVFKKDEISEKLTEKVKELILAKKVSG